jgi:hypothetical protein
MNLKLKITRFENGHNSFERYLLIDAGRSQILSLIED